MGIGFSESVCLGDWMLSLSEKDGRVDECYGDFSPTDCRVSHAGLRTITGEMEI